MRGNREEPVSFNDRRSFHELSIDFWQRHSIHTDLDEPPTAARVLSLRQSNAEQAAPPFLFRNPERTYDRQRRKGQCSTRSPYRSHPPLVALTTPGRVPENSASTPTTSTSSRLISSSRTRNTEYFVAIMAMQADFVSADEIDENMFVHQNCAFGFGPKPPLQPDRGIHAASSSDNIMCREGSRMQRREFIEVRRWGTDDSEKRKSAWTNCAQQ